MNIETDIKCRFPFFSTNSMTSAKAIFAKKIFMGTYIIKQCMDPMEISLLSQKPEL